MTILLKDPCKLPLKKGCYKIFSKRGQVTKRELIYIGKTSNLRKRIIQFIAGCLNSDGYHSGGNTYFKKKKEEGLDILFNLKVSITNCECPECLELELFKKFDKKLKPLLNTRHARKGCGKKHRNLN